MVRSYIEDQLKVGLDISMNEVYERVFNGILVKEDFNDLSEASIFSSQKRKNNLDYMEIVSDKDKKYVPIFIVLTKTNTSFGKAIRTVTNEKYNHVGLSLDVDMDTIYSYTIGKDGGGFVIESFYEENSTSFKEVYDEYAIYMTLVTKRQFSNMEKFLNNTIKNKDKTEYDVIGIPRMYLNKPKEVQLKYFCSSFVSSVMELANKTKINPRRTTPMKVINEKYHMISSGKVATYKAADSFKRVVDAINDELIFKAISETALYLSPIMDKQLEPQDLWNFYNSLNKGIGIYQDEVIEFFPDVIKPVSFYITTSLGGIYLDVCNILDDPKLDDKEKREEISSLVDIHTTDSYNIYKSVYADVDHVIFCTKLYRSMNRILNYSKDAFESPDRDKELREVVYEWESRVSKLYALYTRSGNTEKEKSMIKQGLHELMWDVNYSLYKLSEVNLLKVRFMLAAGYIESGEVVSGFDEQCAKVRTYMELFIKKKLPTDMYFRPSSFELPYLDDISFNQVVIAYQTEDDFGRDEIYENYLRLWMMYGSHIKVRRDTSLGQRLLKDGHKHMVDMDYEVVLNEAIKTRSRNIKIDDEGNILIEKKEVSDFEKHLKESQRLLKRYEKHLDVGGSKDAYAVELAKLYYMAKIIEIYYMRPSSELTKEQQKVQRKMIDTRAKILNVHSQYLDKYIVYYPEFNFKEYFDHSKYGETIKITSREVLGTIKLSKQILRGLGLI